MPWCARGAQVPGAVKGWCDLSDRFGKLPLATVLQPAIYHATNGFPVTEVRLCVSAGASARRRAAACGPVNCPPV